MNAGTIKEKKQGWAEGPLSVTELNSEHPQGWIPGLRFGIPQGTKLDAQGKTMNKTKLIDGLSVSATHWSRTSTEHLNLVGIDEVSGIAKIWTACSSGKEFNITSCERE